MEEAETTPELRNSETETEMGSTLKNRQEGFALLNSSGEGEGSADNSEKEKRASKEETSEANETKMPPKNSGPESSYKEQHICLRDPAVISLKPPSSISITIRKIDPHEEKEGRNSMEKIEEEPRPAIVELIKTADSDKRLHNKRKTKEVVVDPPLAKKSQNASYSIHYPPRPPPEKKPKTGATETVTKTIPKMIPDARNLIINGEPLPEFGFTNFKELLARAKERETKLRQTIDYQRRSLRRADEKIQRLKKKQEKELTKVLEIAKNQAKEKKLNVKVYKDDEIMSRKVLLRRATQIMNFADEIGLSESHQEAVFEKIVKMRYRQRIFFNVEDTLAFQETCEFSNSKMDKIRHFFASRNSWFRFANAHDVSAKRARRDEADPLAGLPLQCDSPSSSTDEEEEEDYDDNTTPERPTNKPGPDEKLPEQKVYPAVSIPATAICTAPILGHQSKRKQQIQLKQDLEEVTVNGEQIQLKQEPEEVTVNGEQIRVKQEEPEEVLVTGKQIQFKQEPVEEIVPTTSTDPL